MTTSQRIASILSLVGGSAPGFILSFAVVRLLPLHDADVFLLVLSTTLIVTNLVGQTMEAAFIAQYGKHFATSLVVSPRSMSRASRRAVLMALPVNVLVFPAILAAYAAFGRVGGSFEELVVCGAIVALFPVVAAQSGVYSSFLIASKRMCPAFASIALRGLPTLVALSVSRSIAVLGIVYVGGEVLRWLFLRNAVLWSRHIDARADNDLSLPSVRGWLAQVFSMGISQLSVVVARTFVASGPVGSVAFADNADKIYFAVNQVVLSGVVLVNIAGLPSSIARTVLHRDRRALLRLDAARVVGAAGLIGILAIAGVGLCRLADPFGLATYFDRALGWSQILLVAVPALAANMWGSRVLLLAELNRWLVPLSVFAATVSVASCSVLFSLYGVTGVVVAIALTQLLVGAAFLVVVDRRAVAPLQATVPPTLVVEQAGRTDDRARGAVG